MDHVIIDRETRVWMHNDSHMIQRDKKPYLNVCRLSVRWGTQRGVPEQITARGSGEAYGTRESPQ